MDPFAQLSSWIDPVEVLDVLIRIESNSAALQKRDTILLQSTVLESGSEAGFKDMVTSYLNSFQVPDSLVTLTMAYYDTSEISLRTISAVASLRFDGTVTAYSKTKVPSEMAQDTVLAIEGSDLLLDLVKYPCMALLDVVSTTAAAWKRQRKTIEAVGRVEFVPSAASRLQIAVETVVASHFGAHIAPEDHGLKIPRTNLGYRSFTISGIPPIPESQLKLARETSVFLAATANQP